MRLFAIALGLPLLIAGAAMAQPACPAPPSWGSNVELTAATASPELEPARLLLDQAATVKLHPGSDVRFLVAPEKPGAAGSYGGMLAVDVHDAGAYHVVLSADAWVDVLKDGAVIRDDVPCSGLPKLMSFILAPGRHVIQLSGNKDATIRVMVSRK
jgi:hypothetical protein